MNSSILRIAHRGGLKERPENTLQSFIECLEAGYQAIEFDIQMLKTGEVIVFHDKNFGRLTGDYNKTVAKTTLEQLRQLTVEGQPIPMLENVLEVLNPTTLFIELKDSRCISKAASVINAYSKKHNIVIIGFSSRRINNARKILGDKSNIKYGLTSNRRPWPILKLNKTTKLDYYICHHWLVSWISVAIAKNNGVKTIVYPVKSSTLSRILSSHRIDGIMYDKKVWAEN